MQGDRRSAVKYELGAVLHDLSTDGGRAIFRDWDDLMRMRALMRDALKMLRLEDEYGVGDKSKGQVPEEPRAIRVRRRDDLMRRIDAAKAETGQLDVVLRGMLDEARAILEGGTV